ncbi:hypothetical protein TPHA_0G02480 [Tetrapisispora phaffii CBS 4417]|uniref:non-specific serine/threonine protein kinase n=1 Tax=Tetrapisispora phaffii (strain ATCC 24235 / CBS 4417 / NBRC 1672 / NRRL Y-8282 / UCD 70-5) TaxID=1071381 RepID=G8BW05_TETPH|nr:hypothetical protein TPHA_0G02480 [Tetrapisispora phaffii CBS 4417]CCE64083.1 hypothetical protein TPHA_0G02480 [Tetrapisispora phaffii CBS 4417]
MYSWKLSKFRFGKGSDKENENKSNNIKNKENSSTKLFGSSDNKRSSTINEETELTDIEKNSINRTSSSLAGMKSRNSTDVNEASSTPPISLDVDNSSTTEKMDIDEQQVIPNNTTSAGKMTIKVYKGEGFILPFPLTSNETVLNKLIQAGETTQGTNNSNDINSLIKTLSDMNIKQKQDSTEEVVLSSETLCKYIPATIRIPGSETLNPLLYFTIEFDNTVATILPESGTINQPVFNKISLFDVTRILPTLKIDVFARIPSVLLPSKSWQDANSFQNEKLKTMFEKLNNNQDIQIGSFTLPINLKIDSAANLRLYSHYWLTLDDDMGKLNITIDYKPTKYKKLSIDDFDLLKVIGKGSFGKVMQVRKKDTQKIYALKAIKKAYIISKSEVTHTLAEKTVLSRIICPFIVPLKFSFQSPEKLYLVLAFINGGELFYHLQKEGRFDLSRSRFYTAELLCALETLHKYSIIYRDLKPENILLDYQGHIALCDFGLSKLNMKDKDKTDTFCGTPEYLAPELLLGQGYTNVVDWWTLGVLLYEMLTGLPPYYDEDVPKMYKKILKEPLRFPEGFDSDAKSLLIGLLSRDPKRRLGYNSPDEIKNHPFFNNLSWNRLWLKAYIPPFKPSVSSLIDTSNFDQEFTKEKPVDSVVDEFLSNSVQQQFGGWTYVGNEQLGSSMVQDSSIN